MLREASEKSSTSNNFLDILNADLYNDNLSDINFAPPKPEECRSKVSLFYFFKFIVILKLILKK